jgi:hypothetical protein
MYTIFSIIIMSHTTYTITIHTLGVSKGKAHYKTDN